MPSGIRPTTNNQLEIYLEKPWGGTASDSDPVDIQDNQFVNAEGVVDVDNKLCQFNMVPDPHKFLFVPSQLGAVPLIIFNLLQALWAVDQFGQIYAYEQVVSTTNTIFTSVGFNPASDGPWGPAPFDELAMSVQVVDGIAYIGVPYRHSIYFYDPTNPANGLVLASNYTGGRVMGIVDDYLLQMNTNSATDGEKPTRVNWSGPGKFTTWDPAIDRTAGFNTYVNIEDAITGFISLASVGVIIGEKGLVEISPTGVGIEPFSFPSLWTSEVGQGILYPFTIAQYGKDTYATTDTGVFRISTAGMNEIGQAARTKILGVVQESSLAFLNATEDVPPLFAGNVMLYAYNSTYPTPFYVLVTTTPITTLGEGSALIIWLLNLTTGAWTNQIYSFTALMNQQNGTTSSNNYWPLILKVASVTTLGFQSNVNGFNTLPNLLVYGIGNAFPDLTLRCFIAPIYIFNKENLTTDLNPPGNLLITSKQWEMKLGRKPTVRRVLLKAYGSGDIEVQVNAIPFGTITLDGTTTSKVYRSPRGVCTEEAPQLTLGSNNFKGVIIKAMLAGTYADGDID